MIRHVGVHRADDAAVVDHAREMRQRFADVDAALAVFREGERRRHEAGALGLFVKIAGRLLACDVSRARASDRTCRGATARRSGRGRRPASPAARSAEVRAVARESGARPEHAGEAEHAKAGAHAPQHLAAVEQHGPPQQEEVSPHRAFRSRRGAPGRIAPSASCSEVDSVLQKIQRERIARCRPARGRRAADRRGRCARRRPRRRLARVPRARSRALHERAVEHEKLLHRRRRDGAPLRVHVGVRIIELHQQIVQLQSADPRVNGALHIARIIDLARFRAGRSRRVRRRRRAPRRAIARRRAGAGSSRQSSSFVPRRRAAFAGVVRAALPIGGREHDLAHQRLDRPAALHEAHGEIIEQFRMRRRRAGVPEVARRGDERLPEEERPTRDSRRRARSADCRGSRSPRRVRARPLPSVKAAGCAGESTSRKRRSTTAPLRSTLPRMKDVEVLRPRHPRRCAASPGPSSPPSALLLAPGRPAFC